MGQSYYIFSSGQIKRKDNTLQLCMDNGQNRDIPIERVRDIYVFSEMTFNTKLINFLSQNGVIIHFFNYYEFYAGSFYPRERQVSGSLLIKQVEHYTDPQKRLLLAKAFVIGAYENIYRNLRYYNGRGKDILETMNEINSLYSHIKYCKNVQELMGIEGNIHKCYYAAWQKIIDVDINFERREKRPPNNMINTLISFVNSIIYTKVLTELYKTQINPTISYLHEPSTKRFSLSLDIAEIFKPLIADRLIFSLLNKKIVTEKDFDKEVEYIRMKDTVAKKIMMAVDSYLKKTIKHKSLNRDVSYQHLMRLEVYKLIKHLTGIQEYKAFKIWW
ncbi:type I-B CRISPR-associated endonuclease Cas1b [Pectinatus cerevisiiphilus]|uniref:CRISPR-associated endonuclease Cas1 n=1 Tax=Pectinatus cerevisiiphilus TaxID=86956 RepID=A0A4R3K3H8_9FIRM|nr:type I-B CRISPR-associated endonuclease Cas1b [Pectinatus cerevisiiphilus]TCS77233.1 CRISPR-associated Cas1 family protein [Pectinatus cerevisiiphilus]